MPRIDLSAVPQTNRTSYPAPLDAPVAGRLYRRLAPAAGLEDFGVSHVTLLPGAWSSQRHWHAGEDEFVVVLSGEAVLIDEGGRTPLAPGDCVAWRKGVADGHHIVNESAGPCVFIAVGKPSATDCHYPDVDMHLDAAAGRFTRKDGSPY